MRRHATLAILLLTVINASFQIFWFGRYTLHNVDFDGISYLGIARHVAEGDFRASLNAFRSPLFSWLIAGCLPFSTNLLLAGKILTVVTFLASAVMLYGFARRLWSSGCAAAVAVLWFTAGRGIVPLSTQFVTPDFLLAFLVLAYFTILIRCLQGARRVDWLLLGAIHAIAFLTKAIALPWLAVTTLVAVVLTFSKRTREGFLCIALSAVFPVAVSVTWAAVLHAKYETWTTGSQFKANLLQWTLHQTPDQREAGGDRFLRDMSGSVDRYMVHDPMPPGATGWRYRLSFAEVAPQVLATEFRNLPAAIKELVIVVTPGGILAFGLVLFALGRKALRYTTPFRVGLCIALSSGVLLLTYCMLVFDERYIFPIVPLILAVSAGAFVGEKAGPEIPQAWRAASIVLALVGVAFSVLYWASPYRTLDRDFQVSCYVAGEELKSRSGQTVVSLGSGPYPAHGVGWEAGFKSAFFGGRQLAAYSDKLPQSSEVFPATSDVGAAAPDAVVIWGNPDNADYLDTVRNLHPNYSGGTAKISDPWMGEIGTILFREKSR